jgi:hypothetical protein
MDIFYPFKILSSPDKEFEAIVISLSSESLTDSMDQIKKELLSSGIHGKILMDYLLSTGQNNKRFFVIEFDGDFLLETFHKITISPALKEYVSDFYSKDYMYINNSLLSDPLKHVYRQKADKIVNI